MLFAVVVGVAIPLAAFRIFVPNEVFPVSYRRGRTAHLDVTGARHDAIVRALEEQLSVIPVAVKPLNLEGSGGSTPPVKAFRRGRRSQYRAGWPALRAARTASATQRSGCLLTIRAAPHLY
jgi:hypothetical protein